MVPSEKLLTGVSICNTVDEESFQKLIEIGYWNIFGSEEEKEAQKVDIQNNGTFLELGKQVGLAIKTITYLLKRLMVFIASPETILEDLNEKLNMDKEKSEALIKFWMAQTKPILDGVNSGRELTEVHWDLKVELGSTTEQKSKYHFGLIRLETADNNQTNLEMNHTELMKLYNILENVQEELDLFKQNTTI